MTTQRDWTTRLLNAAQQLLHETATRAHEPDMAEMREQLRALCKQWEADLAAARRPMP